MLEYPYNKGGILRSAIQYNETEADVWSIEGAVESGRRAAQAIEPTIKVIPQYNKNSDNESHANTHQ